MSCETARRMMETNDPELARHQLTCPACILGAQAPYYEAPPGLEQKIRRGLRQEQGSPAQPWRWMAVAASLLLVASAIGNIVLLRSRVDPSGLLADAVVSAHIRSLNGTHLLDVPSTDRHTVKPWFGGKLDFSPPVKEIEGFPLLGGRLEYFAGHPAAALVYGRRNHVINVFVWPSSYPTGDTAVSRNGYHIEIWTSGGMTFWAVSDLNPDELRQFVSLFQRD